MSAETLIQFFVDTKLAENVWSAANMANGLRLAELPDDEARIERVKLYRKWRPKSNKNDMLPTWQAYALAIAGIEPSDVQVRQVSFDGKAWADLYGEWDAE